MFVNDHIGGLAVAYDRGRELRAEAATERLAGNPATRRILAEFLRRAANRLDPAPLRRRPAFQPAIWIKER